jgi:hypothetical protein
MRKAIVSRIALMARKKERYDRRTRLMKSATGFVVMV